VTAFLTEVAGRPHIANIKPKTRADMVRALRCIATGGSGYDDTIAIKTRRASIHALIELGLVVYKDPFTLVLTEKGKEMVS
jgi:hypothetical protein